MAVYMEGESMSEQTTQESIAEIWQLFKEASERFKEISDSFKETDARFKETDVRFKETDVRFKETDEKLRKLEGLFGVQWGRMMEALVKPAALQLFRDRGIDVHHTYQRLESRINGHTMELDIVLENDRDSVVIEVKSLVRVEDIDDLLQDLKDIMSFFTRYAGRRVYAAIAGLEYAEGADRYAYRKGLFVLGLTGDGLVTVRNDDNFKPRNFGEVIE